MNNYCGVYMIQNNVNNKMYIGIAEDIGMRWATHMSLLQSGKHPSVYLQKAVKEYGIDNFTFTILCECSKDKLYEMLNSSLKHLKEEGKLYFVINKNQGAKSIIKDYSKDYEVEVIKKNKGFFVICIQNR